MKIESVRIKHILDKSPDTSWIGEYTDKADEWSICRHCGEYLYNAERYDRLTSILEDEIFWMEEWEEDETHPVVYDAMQTALNKFFNRQHDCPHSIRKCNYFKPYACGEPEGSKNYQNYGLEDYKRMEALNRGDFSFIGIMAEATVSYSTGNGNRRLETFTSGGLWGIESDSSDDYIKEVEEQELDDLKEHLTKFGVDVSALPEIEHNDGY